MKKLLLIIGLLIVLFVGALIAIPLLVDPNDYKEQIIAQVEKHTGRTLSLPGELKMSKFPSLGVDIGEMTFGNAPGFGDEPMIKSGHASVSVKVLPLLKRDLQVSTLSLKDVAINLAVDKSGKTNWDDLTSKEAKEEKSSGDKKALAAFALGGIDLQNANLVWDDQSLGKKYTVSNLNLKTGKLELNKPIDVDMTCSVDAAAEGIAGDLALSGNIEYDLAGRRYTIKPLDFSGKLSGEAIPGGAADISLQSTSAEIDLEQGKLDIAGFDLDALGTKVQGDIAASRIFDKIPLASGNITIDAQSIPDLLNALGQNAAALPLKSLQAETQLSSTADSMKLENLSAKAVLEGEQIPNSPVDVTLDTTADVNLTEETLNVESFVIKGMGLDVQGSVNGSDIIKNPFLKGDLKVAPFNLRDLMEQMNMEVPVTADPKVLTDVGLTSNFSVTKTAIKLKELAMKLDDTNISGAFGLINLSNPAPNFDLTIDSINADRYLPPKSEEEKAVAASSGGGEAAEMDLEPLRKLKAKGNLNIGELIISNAKLSNIKLGLDANGGKIKLSPAQASLYQGSHSGTVAMDATGSKPAININSSLKGVQVEPLLKDLTGKSKIAGQVAGKINVSGVGSNATSIKKTLNGNADLDFSDGAILGVNIARVLREGKAKLSGEKLPATGEPAKTDFSELGASVNIKNGLINNQDFLMKSPFLRVTGAGNADLPSENIDYRLVTTLVSSLKGQGGEGLDELKGIDIPVKVTGTFSDPKYAPDLGGVLKAKVDQELDEQKDKLKEKANEKLKDILPGELGGLLGGKKEAESASEAPAPAQQQAAPAPAQEPEPKKSLEDEAKDKIKDLLKF